MMLPILLLFSPGPGPGPGPAMWGLEGHRIVCEIAYQRLTPAARSMVLTIRAADPDSGSSFADSCLWADRVRSTTHRQTNAYHYINIPPGSAGADLARDCADPDRRCAPWAIKHYALVLREPGAALERAEALKFLAHFVGDIHQPLHAGRSGDLGGNTIRVDFFGQRDANGDSLNLHRVWDSSILERAGLGWPDSVSALHAEITPAEAAAWENSGPLGWVDESYREDESLVYQLPPGNRIDAEYFGRAIAVSRLRLKQAAVRLAELLNRIAAGTLDGSLGMP
ncbi:MAG TPA: S1/P1 nuclease [Gemmatimonadales bacterium]|nr:S1/P1 nuclease [Gemmatimonadales bacterium]